MYLPATLLTTMLYLEIISSCEGILLAITVWTQYPQIFHPIVITNTIHMVQNQY
jgi:hypothetical protein